MAEKVFLIHGWSVEETTTYQALHLRLSQFGFTLHDIFLGRYVSLDNEVEVDDIARAMHLELERHLGPPPWSGPFHFITHSTGALVVKHWIVHHYIEKYKEKRPLKNLVFLAGPHFGSRLAHHGRSMLAHAAYFGPTGKKILISLELGSNFSWENNGFWLNPNHWRRKGIRPYCLIGDRVEKSLVKSDLFKSKIFPAGYEAGSDMVVRVPSGNLNFRRYELSGVTGTTRKVGEVKDIPFTALSDYVHSGDKHGIMKSITTKADPKTPKYLNLKLILQCLKVKNKPDYDRIRADLTTVTKKTRKLRQPFAQLDFRFRDETGAPIEDYSFSLGAIVNEKEKPSKTVAHTHKNKIDPSHFTVFLNLKHLEPHLTYFMDFNSDSGTELFRYTPDPYRVNIVGRRLTEVINADQTTQIDVILGRELDRNLFVFHRGDDPGLHVKWDRKGEIIQRGIPVK